LQEAADAIRDVRRLPAVQRHKELERLVQRAEEWARREYLRVSEKNGDENATAPERLEIGYRRSSLIHSRRARFRQSEHKKFNDHADTFGLSLRRFVFLHTINSVDERPYGEIHAFWTSRKATFLLQLHFNQTTVTALQTRDVYIFSSFHDPS